MKRHSLFLKTCSAGLGLSLLAACSGGGNSTPGSNSSGSLTHAQFVIRVPNKTTPVRAPQYISPSTKSLSIAVDGAPSPTLVDLTPTSSSCTTVSSVLTCTVTASVLPGTHAFTITTYDNTQGAGNKLSQAVIPGVKITAGASNTVPVTLGGIIATIAVGLTPTSPLSGSPSSVTVTVNAKDAAGNTIIGSDPYTSPISLSDSDSSGATTLSTATVTSPSTTVTLAYTGAPSLHSATISATADGVASSAITPATLKPVSTSSGGSEAISVFPKGGQTIALIPSSGGLSAVTIAHGSTLQGLKKAQFQPAITAGPPPIVTQENERRIGEGLRQAKSSRHLSAALSGGTLISVTPQPDECATNYSGLVAYCINYGNNVVTKIDLNTLKQTDSFTTDAGVQSSLSFSGGSCTICGIVYDSQDSAFIISSANGYEVFKESDGSPIKTIAEPAGENFGYNPVTNQVISPEYGGKIRLIDIASGQVYGSSSAVPSISTPDSAAFDPSTNMAIVPEEYQTIAYMLSFDGAVLTPPAASGGIGTYSSTTTSTTLDLPTGLALTDMAVDSASHIAFAAAEFGYGGPITAIQLPSTSVSNPVPGDYAYINLPAEPDGLTFSIPGDPHATATYNLAGEPLGLTFNSSSSYVAVIDLKKLLQAPREASSPHHVDPSYDLLANGVVTYYAI